MKHSALNAFGEPTSINGALAHYRKILWQTPPESPEWAEAAHRMMAILADPVQAELIYSESACHGMASDGGVAVLRQTGDEAAEQESLQVSRTAYLTTVKTDLDTGMIPSLENLLLAFPQGIDISSPHAQAIHAEIVKLLEAVGPLGRKRALQLGLLLDLRHMDGYAAHLKVYGTSLPSDSPAARQLQARLSATNVIRNLFVAKLQHALATDPSNGGRIDLKRVHRISGVRDQIVASLRIWVQRLSHRLRKH